MYTKSMAYIHIYAIDLIYIQGGRAELGVHAQGGEDEGRQDPPGRSKKKGRKATIIHIHTYSSSY